MQVSTSDGKPLRGDLINRVILRTDLTPIPSTVEITATTASETTDALKEGATIKVGAEQTEYELVRANDDAQGVKQDTRDVKPIKAYGILKSCAALGRLLQRSVIREGSNFADIYRSIGATATVETDFAVPAFSAFVGMLPTPEVAKVLQEEAAVVFLAPGGKLRFRRLTDLIAEEADLTFPVERTQEMARVFLEKHAIPFTVSTEPDGSVVTSKREAARGINYRPRADQRILANMGTVLVQRRKMRETLQPSINAGRRVDIGGRPHIVVTAVHVRATATDDAGGEEFTRLWLGEVVS